RRIRCVADRRAPRALPSPPPSPRPWRARLRRPSDRRAPSTGTPRGWIRGGRVAPNDCTSAAMLRFGIDLSGTKIEIVGLDDRGEIVLRRRRPGPSGRYEYIVAAVAELVTTAERELGRTGTVGVGTPGSRSPFTGLMRNSNTVVLNGTALQAYLQ